MEKLFDKSHTYEQAFVVCDCHSEILGFFSMANTKDPGYFLNCYSARIERKHAKSNEFYFPSKEDALRFAEAIVGKDVTVFKEKKNHLSVSFSDNFVVIQFIWDEMREVTWEVILSYAVASDFSKEICSIIEKVSKAKGE